MKYAMNIQDAERIGEARGEARGRMEAIREIVINLLDKFNDIDIVKFTGASLNEVAKIRKEYQAQ